MAGRTQEAEVRSLWERNCEPRTKDTGNDFFFCQYVGRVDAFFFRRLAHSRTDWESVPPSGGAGFQPATEPREIP